MRSSGAKGWPFSMPIAAYSDYLWVEGVVRLVLDYGVDLLVEVKVVGVDRVEPFPEDRRTLASVD